MERRDEDWINPPEPKEEEYISSVDSINDEIWLIIYPYIISYHTLVSKSILFKDYYICVTYKPIVALAKCKLVFHVSYEII